MNFRKLIYLQLACLLTSLAAEVVAQDVVLSTTLGVDVFHEDQFEIQIDDSETNSLVYRPSLSIGYTGQRNISTVGFGAVYNQFSNSDFQDNTNFNFGWDQQRVGPDSTLGLAVDYSERLISQLVEFDDNADLSSSDSVQVFTVSPQYSKQLSVRSAAEFAYLYSQSEVSSASLESSENEQHGLSAGWTTTLSPTSTFAMNLGYVAFRREAQDELSDVQTDLLSLTLGGTHQLTNNWSIDADFGASVVELDSDALDEDGEEAVVEDGDVLAVGNIAATYDGQRDTVSLSVNSAATQQLDGVVDNQRSLRVNWNRQVSQTLAFSLSGQYFQADRNDRDNYNANFSLSWQPAQKWQYQLAYSYRKQASVLEDLVSTEIEGESNRVTLTLEYSFDDMRFGI